MELAVLIFTRTLNWLYRCLPAYWIGFIDFYQNIELASYFKYRDGIWKLIAEQTFPHRMGEIIMRSEISSCISNIHYNIYACMYAFWWVVLESLDFSSCQNITNREVETVFAALAYLSEENE